MSSWKGRPAHGIGWCGLACMHRMVWHGCDTDVPPWLGKAPLPTPARTRARVHACMQACMSATCMHVAAGCGTATLVVGNASAPCAILDAVCSRLPSSCPLVLSCSVVLLACPVVANRRALSSIRPKRLVKPLCRRARCRRAILLRPTGWWRRAGSGEEGSRE